MSLTTTQRGVLQGMIAGAITTALVIGLGAALNPFGYPDELSAAQRLVVVAQSSALLAICLAVAIARLARHRFFTPEDIHGGGLHPGTERAQLLQSLLQNTLEQAVLALLVQLAWALTLPASALSVVPLAALAFAIGRALFFTGYERGAPARALGFTLSFYPSVGMLICLVVHHAVTLL